jgi:hypothetical protein
MGLPIHDAARRAIAHAGHVLATDIEHAEDDLSKLTHHRRYHQQQTPATTAATEAPVSLISTLEDDFAEVRDKVEEFAKSKLPTALSDIKKVEGSDLFTAVVGAAHVPPEFLSVATNFINELSAKFPKATTTETASEPETSDVPQPVAAGPVVAGQA